MIKHFALLFINLIILNVDFATCQSSQGGTMTYKVLKSTADSVTIRFFHKFLQVNFYENDAKNYCSGQCLSSLISNEDIRYKQFNFTSVNGSQPQVNKFNSSFYCDTYNGNENIIIGSRETDLSLSKKIDVYEFSNPECCTYDDPGSFNTYNKLTKFALNVDLRLRNDNKSVNTVPDTRSVPIYAEMNSKNLQKYLNFSDSDGDEIRCRWSGVCSDCTIFDLLPNCTLKLLKTSKTEKFLLGISVEDFYKNSTVKNALSTVPFYMVVFVTPSTYNATSIRDCPADRVKPILNTDNNVRLSKSNSISASIILLGSVIFINLLKS